MGSTCPSDGGRSEDSAWVWGDLPGPLPVKDGSPPIPEDSLWHLGLCLKKSSSEFSVPSGPPHSLLGGPWRLPGLSGSEPRFKVVFSCSRPTPEQFDDAKGSHMVGSSTSMAGRPEFTSSHRDSAQLCRPAPVGFQHARSRSRARRRERQHELLGAGLPHAHRLCSRVSRALGAMQGAATAGPSQLGGDSGKGPRVALQAFSVVCRCWDLGLERKHLRTCLAKATLFRLPRPAGHRPLDLGPDPDPDPYWLGDFADLLFEPVCPPGERGGGPHLAASQNGVNAGPQPLDQMPGKCWLLAPMCALAPSWAACSAPREGVKQRMPYELEQERGRAKCPVPPDTWDPTLCL